jgi:hypothetical protein
VGARSLAACYASARGQRLTAPPSNARNYPASEAPDPGRHHLGMPGRLRRNPQPSGLHSLSAGLALPILASLGFILVILVPRGGIELSSIELKSRYFSNEGFPVYPSMYPALSVAGGPSKQGLGLFEIVRRCRYTRRWSASRVETVWLRAFLDRNRPSHRRNWRVKRRTGLVPQGTGHRRAAAFRNSWNV